MRLSSFNEEEVAVIDGVGQLPDSEPVAPADDDEVSPEESPAPGEPAPAKMDEPEKTEPQTQSVIEVDGMNAELKTGQIGLPAGQAGRLLRIEKFWDHLKAAGKGARTIKEYKYEYAWWSSAVKAEKKAAYSLKVDEIEGSLKDLHPSTARRKTAFLRRLAKWYLRHGKNRLHVEAAKVISPRIPHRLPGDLGRKKFVELRGQARTWCEVDGREGIWLGLLLMCGLRVSEVQTAKALDEEFIKVLGKGNKERKIPAPGWLLAARWRVN